jgi:hypothetical protein
MLAPTLRRKQAGKRDWEGNVPRAASGRDNRSGVTGEYGVRSRRWKSGWARRLTNSAKHGRGVAKNRDSGVENAPGIEKSGNTAKTSSHRVKVPRLPMRSPGLGDFARGSAVLFPASIRAILGGIWFVYLSKRCNGGIHASAVCLVNGCNRS